VQQTKKEVLSISASVLFHSNNTLFSAYFMPMYACQLWNKYKQTSMKRLCAAYNNAYRIVHNITRNASVRLHHVNHRVSTFDVVLRNNLLRFFIRYAFSSNCFIRSLPISDAFSLFSPIIQRSFMMATNCNSCWCIISVFVSHECCFFVVKKNCVHQCAQTKHPKSKKYNCQKK